MEKTDFNKQILLGLIVLGCFIQEGTAYSTSPTSSSSCVSSTANINYTFSLDGTESIIGTRIWFFGVNKIAESDGTTLTPVLSYSSRLTAYGTYGISLSNVLAADSGIYTYVIALLPSGNPFTATASLSVKVAPLAPPSGCSVNATQSRNNVTCTVNTGSGNCGTPLLNAHWVNYTTNSSQFECTMGGTYQCCATSDSLTCYSGSPNDFCILYNCTSVATTRAATTSTTTTTTTTVTSSSTSMSSATSSVTIDNTSIKPTTTGSSASATSGTSSNRTIGIISVNPTTNGSSASATNSTSTSMTPTAVSPTNNTNNISTSTNPTISGSTTTNKTTSNGSKSIISDIDIKVIVPAVVVPCGLLIIGAIIFLVVLCVRRRAGKHVHESPDGMAVQDKGSNIDERQQSLGHGKAIDNLDAVYTSPDGFIIYPGPAAISTARSYKDKKYHDVTYQYSRPYPGTCHHQSAYVPSTYTSARAYAHKDKKHYGVTDQYSRPSTGTYGYQAAYVPSTYTSARTYAQKDKSYDYEGPICQQASHLMATSRPAYDQTIYYSQNGYYRHSGDDVYYSSGGQYWQRSRLHDDHNGRKQQREYYNQYEMADFGGKRAGFRHTKQDMAFSY